MDMDAAHKSRWEIAEVVLGIPFLIGIALHFIVPLSVPQGILRQILLLVGILLIAVGIGVIVSARRQFALFKQPTDPGHATSQIIQTGLFALSRNPLYLGGILLLLGLALALNRLWALLMLPLSMVICLYVLILPEERYLVAKFGEEYEAYMASVRRWFGRK
ncbi:MAG: methyltransferase [Chloroflexota bacterium]